MPLDMWTSAELIALRQDNRMDAVPSHFLDTYFTETHYSDKEYIMFSELPASGRYLAPFVLPTEQGKPIYKEKGEKVSFIKPGYIKPKDAVRPTEAVTKRPSELLRGEMSLQERFDQKVADVQRFHIRAIRNREAWMAARAFIDGRVTIEYERDRGGAFETKVLDFGRAANQTATLSGNYWSAASYDILGDIQTWADRMFAAPYGGFPARIYVGREVAKVFRTNTGILKELDTQRRGTDVDIRTGLITREDPMQYIGYLGAGIEVYAYSDQFQNNDDSMVDILGPKEILMVAPGATGIRAYGAIYDVDAFAGGVIQTDIFPKMWKTPDPGELYIMHQSAPLPIPMYPNRTFKATVLA